MFDAENGANMSSDTRNTSSSGKKKGGGFLSRQVKTKRGPEASGPAVTEEELLKKPTVSPDDILKLDRVTESKRTPLILNI